MWVRSLVVGFPSDSFRRRQPLAPIIDYAVKTAVKWSECSGSGPSLRELIVAAGYPERADEVVERVAARMKEVAPSLPVEILLVIGDYLEPGSRSLLNLARSCRDLYGLLLARLYKSFSTTYLYRNLNATPKGKERSIWVPLGLEVIECLDLTSGYETGRCIDLLLAAQSNLVELSCNYGTLVPYSVRNVHFRKLRNLIIHLDESYFSRPGAPLPRMPNLATLMVEGYPNVGVMNMLGEILPPTARIDLDLTDHEDWAPEQMSERSVCLQDPQLDLSRH